MSRSAGSLVPRAVTALVLVNVLWGVSFPIMRMTNELLRQSLPSPSAATTTGTAFEVATASFYVTVRFCLALVLLRLFLPGLFQSLSWSGWIMGTLVGVAFSVGLILQTAGLNQIPASRSGFLTSLAVVFTPLLLVLVEWRFPRLPVIAGAAVALLGTAILTGLLQTGGPFGIALNPAAGGQLGRGDWLTIVAAFTFGWQIILVDVFGRKMSPAQLSPGMFLATILIGATVFSAGQAVTPSLPPLTAWTKTVTVPFLLLTLLTALVCTVAAFHLMNKYQPFVSPAHAAVLYTLEPICATLWACVLPDWLSPLLSLDYRSERPGWDLVIGGLLIVAGNVFALWPTAPAAALPSPRTPAAA